MDDDERRSAALGWSLEKYRREVKRWADGLEIAAMPSSVEPAEPQNADTP
jgi:hypothetical protein